MDNFSIRSAVPGDEQLILDLIIELAVYEKLENQVVADVETLRQWLFERRTAEALIAECDGQPIGYALFFHNFSTFLGRGGIYIEDVYIRPQYRGRGYGKALFVYIAQLAAQRGCGRVEWACLDWNEPSIRFYLSLGAVKMSEWSVYRLCGEPLSVLAKQSAAGINAAQ